FAPYAYYGLGWTQVKENQFDKADATLTSLIDKHKNHKVAAESLLARAVAREKLNKFGPAIADIDTFLATDPKGRDRIDALMIKGRCAARDGKPADAVKTFEEVVAESPDGFAKDEVLYELAWAHREAKQEDKAVATFERLSKEFPKSQYAAESLHHVGQSHYAKEDYKKAALAYYAAMNAAKDKKLKEKAAHKLAWSYYMQDDYKNAEASFDYQLQAMPKGSLAADATYMLGESQFKQGGEKMTAALETYKKALALEPSTPTLKVLALLHAGQAASVLKKWDDSLEYLTSLTTDHADSELVPEALYEKGWATQNKGDLDGALELYEQVIDKASRTLVGARARFMTGEILFAKKQHTKAMAQFGRVFLGFKNAPPEFDTWKANSLFEYARCLEVLKKADAAKKYYIKLVDEYPKSDKVALAKQRIEALGG
ncbi:MAG: tetratricopeptide repeat protein, partial [Pirellulales bacterium]|nr:tetratricopeptide repeat protein [Pirellulales bacterium]